MTDHLAVLEQLKRDAVGLSREDHEALDAAIALMRGQSEMSKKVEPAPNWCPTCGRRPNDPHAAFCSNPFHLMPKDSADEQ